MTLAQQRGHIISDTYNGPAEVAYPCFCSHCLRNAWHLILNTCTNFVAPHVARFCMYLHSLCSALCHVHTIHRLQQPSMKYKNFVAHVKFLWLLQVVRQIWAYIKEHDLQNPQDRRKIIPDEVLGTFLTAPVNMMSMNSQLSKHCFTKGTHTLLFVPCVDCACNTSNLLRLSMP